MLLIILLTHLEKKYGKDKDTDNKQAATHYVNAMTNENFGVHGK